jgi:hypothetical protein
VYPLEAKPNRQNNLRGKLRFKNHQKIKVIDAPVVNISTFIGKILRRKMCSPLPAKFGNTLIIIIFIKLSQNSFNSI